ncbi:MAG: hypothetical protein GY765_27905 [bacterium]|nr:hypothetical protein [bacterium]
MKQFVKLSKVRKNRLEDPRMSKLKGGTTDPANDISSVKKCPIIAMGIRYGICIALDPSINGPCNYNFQCGNTPLYGTSTGTISSDK